MLLSWLQKHIRSVLLLLLVLLGIALGQLAANLLGLSLGQVQAPLPQAPAAARPEPPFPPLKDFITILQRNIFQAQTGDMAGFGQQVATAATAAPARQPKADLQLIGTVTGGEIPLAVIVNGRETETYRLGAELPGGAKLAEVGRNRVTIEYPDGRREVLEVASQGGTGTAAAPSFGTRQSSTRSSASAAAAQATAGSKIQQIGENRWQIPAAEAEAARSNINELLRQARVEPNIVNGETAGFVVRMIRPGSLFAMLGIQIGDVLREVNGVTLDTPEKALQIFQQLREAKQIQISLERGNQPQVFSYEIQ